ncbi:MAG: hypothetical protein ACXABN_18520 [Candidatus Thorarchaeota archaeon]|jgi:hypothetical protein
MKFIFRKETGKFSGITTVDVIVENGAIDNIGTLHLDESEWEILRAILLDGVNLFQENEAKVEVFDQDSVPAYLEGI